MAHRIEWENERKTHNETGSRSNYLTNKKEKHVGSVYVAKAWNATAADGDLSS